VWSRTWPFRALTTFRRVFIVTRLSMPEDAKDRLFAYPKQEPGHVGVGIRVAPDPLLSPHERDSAPGSHLA